MTKERDSWKIACEKQYHLCWGHLKNKKYGTVCNIAIVVICGKPRNLEISSMLENVTRSFIEELQQNVAKPKWSVMIPTYNGTKYLRETLESVLVQDPGRAEMQIEVVDDFSTVDDPEQLVTEIGEGRISFFRQAENQGQIQTWNNCIRRARGEWIHILHQDDTVLPGFYESLQSVAAMEHVGAAFCRNIYMDEDGHWQYFSPLEQKESGVLENWLDKISISQRIQFPSIVVRRSIYERLGGFCPNAYSAADWEMWKRISAHYRVWYEPKPLACFRLHSGSETSRLVQSGENIAHTREAIEISKAYLPKLNGEELSKRARRNYALYALNTARQLLIEGNITVAITQIKESLKCEKTPFTLWVLTRTIVKASLNHLLITISSKG